MRGGGKKGNRIRGISAISLKIVLHDANMMKSKLIRLGNQPETLVEISFCGLFFRPDIGEKVNSYFHWGLSITEVDKAAAPNDNTKP